MPSFIYSENNGQRKTSRSISTYSQKNRLPIVINLCLKQKQNCIQVFLFKYLQQKIIPFLLPFVCRSINNIFDIYIFLKAIYCKHVTIMYLGKYNLSLLNKLVYLQNKYLTKYIFIFINDTTQQIFFQTNYLYLALCTERRQWPISIKSSIINQKTMFIVLKTDYFQLWFIQQHPIIYST